MTKKKTRNERAQERYELAYRMGKARTGMRDPEVAKALGFDNVLSLRRRRKDLDKISVAEFAKLALILRWTPEDIDGIIHELTDLT